MSYVNGADLLVLIGTKAFGHCTSHSVSISTETKERVVKPLASQNVGGALFKEKSVKSLSVTVSCDGLHFYDETETGYNDLVAKISAGEAVTLKGIKRETGDAGVAQGNNETFTGSFVCTSLELTAPADDDASYKATFENTGVVTFS